MNIPGVEMVDRLPVLPARAAASNKGTFGRVLLVCGSRGMSGAAVLCGSSALRGGAGLVKVAVPAEVLPIVAAGNPCYLTAGLPHDHHGQLAAIAQEELLALARWSNVVALGPGLGSSPGITALVTALLQQSDVPLILDADALNALKDDSGPLRGRKAPTVLTPHPGEFSRLTGESIATIQANRAELAVRFAADFGLILLLKGHQTLVTDGRQLYRNATGNPGLATGGTGDVLTGLIAALLGQGLEAFAAAQLGAWWHGLAADLARDELTEVCLTAADLLDYLPAALKSR